MWRKLAIAGTALEFILQAIGVFSHDAEDQVVAWVCLIVLIPTAFFVSMGAAWARWIIASLAFLQAVVAAGVMVIAVTSASGGNALNFYVLNCFGWLASSLFIGLTVAIGFRSRHSLDAAA